MKTVNCDHDSSNKVRKQIRRIWGKSTDDDLDALRGNMQQVTGLLKKNDEKFEDFKNSLDNSLDSASCDVGENRTFCVTAILIAAGLFGITGAIFRYGFRNVSFIGCVKNISIFLRSKMTQSF